MMNVLLLSDSDCENDEKGYIEEETMKFKESGYLQDTSSDAWGEKNDFLCPATSREKKKQRRKYSCTVCSKPLSKTKVTRHPLLRVCVLRLLQTELQGSCFLRRMRMDLKEHVDGVVMEEIWSAVSSVTKSFVKSA
ncbi:hypothetical protein O6H91_02G152500 [Diphasiastrum complanatum]|uniref:Uncharacterized protein n=1 Tax=Diphasiastrum complanatum TaxID=34168 RepID=A0ACC2ELX9_DIPCM|nr:hypothetical protein O6H91_02G152500 [Diphasiastrum complanatum]